MTAREGCRGFTNWLSPQCGAFSTTMNFSMTNVEFLAIHWDSGFFGGYARNDIFFLGGGGGGNLSDQTRYLGLAYVAEKIRLPPPHTHTHTHTHTGALY